MEYRIKCLLITIAFVLNGCGGSTSNEESSVYIGDYLGVSSGKVQSTQQSLPSKSLTQAHFKYAFSKLRRLSPVVTSQDSYRRFTQRYNDEPDDYEYISELIAPLDVQFFLAQLSMGAEGATRDAFSAVSDFNFKENISYADISLWEQQITQLNSIDRQKVLWGQSGYLFRRGFLDAQVEYWAPEIKGLNFLQDPYTSENVIYETLYDEQLSPVIDRRSRLVVFQVSQLASGWNNGINVTPVIGRFGEQNIQRVTNMLKITGDLNSFETEEYSAVELPFASDELAMLIITPAQGQFESVRKKLNGALWKKLTSSLSVVNVSIQLPELVLEREYLSSGFYNLGVAFNREVSASEEAADFSGINNQGFLYLSSPVQNTELNLNVSGLSAKTALTAVLSATDDEPTNLFDDSFGFNANFNATIVTSYDPFGGYSSTCISPPDQRPFIFAVYAKKSGAILYLGEIGILDVKRIDPGCGE